MHLVKKTFSQWAYIKANKFHKNKVDCSPTNRQENKSLSQNIEGLHGFAPDFIGSKAVFSSECAQNCKSGCTEQSVLQPQRE